MERRSNRFNQVEGQPKSPKAKGQADLAKLMVELIQPVSKVEPILSGSKVDLILPRPKVKLFQSRVMVDQKWRSNILNQGEGQVDSASAKV